MRRQMMITSVSQQATVSEVVLNDDVSDCVEDKLDIVSVRRDSELCVDIFGVAASIQRLKLLLDVDTRLLVRISTCTLHSDTAQQPTQTSKTVTKCETTVQP